MVGVFLIFLSACCNEAYLVTQQDLFLRDVPQEPRRYAMVTASGEEVWSCASVDGLPESDCVNVVVDDSDWADGSDWVVTYLGSNFDLELQVWEGEDLLFYENLQWEADHRPLRCDLPYYVAVVGVSGI